MNKSFRLVNKNERAVFDKAAREWHEAHAKAGLRLGILVVTGDGDGEQALVTHHGATCAAKVFLTDWKMKLLAQLDAVIIIDGDKFAKMKPERAIAVADHELTHISVLDPAVDEHGVARVVLIQDDWHSTGFVACVERHGDDAIEARAIAKVAQVIFPFMEDKDAKAPTLVPDVVATEPTKPKTATERLVEHCAGGQRSADARSAAVQARDAKPGDGPSFDSLLVGPDKKPGKRGGGRKKKSPATAA